MATQPITIWDLVRNFLRALWRAIRQVFHETTGTMFFLIALWALNSSWRAWNRGAAQWTIVFGAGYALLMICLGVMAFRDSRRVR